MFMFVDEIIVLIKVGILDVEIEMEDLVGDNDYWKVVVISEVFWGKLCVVQYQLVYVVLGIKMGNEFYVLVLEI